MNERIKELALQAGAEPTPFSNVLALVGNDIEKFAELIVKECINVVEQTPTHCAFTTYDYSTVVCTISKSVEFLKTEFGLPK